MMNLGVIILGQERPTAAILDVFIGGEKDQVP